MIKSSGINKLKMRDLGILFNCIISHCVKFRLNQITFDPVITKNDSVNKFEKI